MPHRDGQTWQKVAREFVAELGKRALGAKTPEFAGKPPRASINPRA